MGRFSLVNISQITHCGNLVMNKKKEAQLGQILFIIE